MWYILHELLMTIQIHTEHNSRHIHVLRKEKKWNRLSFNVIYSYMLEYFKMIPNSTEIPI